MLSYASDTTGFTIDMSTLNAAGGYTVSGPTTSYAYGDTLKNFETIVGGSGNDTLIVKDLSASFDGGAGTDTIDFSKIGSGVAIALSIGSLSAPVLSGVAIYANVETVVGTAYGDAITGTSANETFSAFIDLAAFQPMKASGDTCTNKYAVIRPTTFSSVQSRRRT